MISKTRRGKFAKKSDHLPKIDKIVGSGGATGTVEVQDENGKIEGVETFREGTDTGSVLSGENDITSIDSQTAADTTAFPTYIDKEGNVTSAGPRNSIAENVTNLPQKRKAKKSGGDKNG